MTTKVIIKHEGTKPKDKNLLISRRYDDPKQRYKEVVMWIKPGKELVTFVWPGAFIEIKEEV